jgi:hypothetical protein
VAQAAGAAAVGAVHADLQHLDDGFGLNTGFAPEETLVRAGTGRVAIAYRLRRAVLLAWRALRYGDVRVGWFWLGWWRTRWTPSGYDGWTNPARKAPPVLPRSEVCGPDHGARRFEHRRDSVRLGSRRSPAW